MLKWLALFLILLCAGSIASARGAAEAKKLPWKPIKPITVIVPWSSGGSIDLLTRSCTSVLEDHLGQKMIIVNQPGASGSIGTKDAMGAAHDGYTWTCGAAADLGAYKLLDFMDTRLEDWELFLNVANVSVVGVNPDSPYQTFDDLLKAFKNKPGQITVATDGPSSAGHNAIEAIRRHAGIEYKLVTYDGGNPAVMACVTGQTEVVTQLAVEQADMLRGGKLRALAVLADTGLKIQGYDKKIPSIKKWLPKLEAAPSYFGIWIPKDAPKEVIETFSILWETVIKNNQRLIDYAADRGAIFDPYWGEEAQKKAFLFLQQAAWIYYDAGKARHSPKTIGIARPE